MLTCSVNSSIRIKAWSGQNNPFRLLIGCFFSSRPKEQVIGEQILVSRLSTGTLVIVLHDRRGILFHHWVDFQFIRGRTGEGNGFNVW